MKEEFFWTVVLKECKIDNDGNSQWITVLNFYNGDLSNKNIDWVNDWRFCEIKKKRKQVKLLGVCKAIFPIKFPLSLTNNIVIESENFV